MNGRSLEGMKLPELQSCMYQEEGETTFTIEYDVGKQVHIYLSPKELSIP